MREKGRVSPQVPLLLDAWKYDLVCGFGRAGRSDQQALAKFLQPFAAGGRLPRVTIGTTIAGMTTAAVRAIICTAVR